MKKGRVQDERIISQRRKIGSAAFGIVFYGLLVSMLIQQFVFDAPFSQYAAEFILFFVAAAYIVVGNIRAGNDLFYGGHNGQKIVIINSLVSGFAMAAIAVVLNTLKYGFGQMGGAALMATTALITFFCGTLLAFLGFETIYIFNQRKQKQMDDKYNDNGR